MKAPKWYQRAIAAGRRHPCPICRATGAISTKRSLDKRARRNMPFMKCYHCQGTGDESAAIRRNRGGRRSMV